MKVLFVYSDINTMGLGGKSYHFGIGALSASLKNRRHASRLFYTQKESNVSLLLKEIKEFGPDVIGYTSDTTQFPYIKKIIGQLKNLKVFSILGGCHASLSPGCLTEVEGLNAICIGEGEEPLSELVQSLENRNDIKNIPSLWIKTQEGRIIKNPTRPFISNLDSLPFSDYDSFDYQRIIDSDCGRLSFMLSRGCPFSCAYCASPVMGKLQEGKYVRFMSVERAIAELKHLKSRYSFKTIFFADDTFTIDKEYVSRFSEIYKKEINIPFEVNARVETISVGILEALKKAGCFKVHMGIEHGNEIFRKNILNRSMSNELIISAFKLAKDQGLATKSYNIVGFPFETEKLHQDTVNINRQINPTGHVCYIFQPYPGTGLYDICLKEGFLKNNGSETVTHSRRDTILGISGFSRKDILRSHRNFSYKVYKGQSLRKAIIYKLYYSRYGEILIRLLSPFKNALKGFVMR